jgi:hypothetical protein
MAHADWGSAPAKRLVATAELSGGVYRARAPSAVAPTGCLLERMRLTRGRRRDTLLGFDFPIGIPGAYAERARIERFSDWFRRLDPASAFFRIARDLDEVSTARPFFPASIRVRSPKLKERFHAALGISGHEALRRCERAHCRRRPASEMFWSLGPQAVGKATLAGWRDTLRPAFAEPGHDYAMWPFDGALTDLLGASDAVIVEAYPAEAYRRLGLRMGTAGRAKTRQADRRDDAHRLLEWCALNAVRPEDDLAALLADGFGPTPAGEDAFDAVVGLFGMIDAARRGAEPELPDDPSITAVEGWMFGRHAICP